MRHPRDGRHVIDRSHGVRRIPDRNEFRAWTDGARHIRHIEGAFFGVDIDHPNDGALFFERFPGCDVGIMIQARQDNLITGTNVTPKCAADRKGQRGHVWSENHLVRSTPQKISHSGARRVNRFVSAATGCKCAMSIGIVVDQIIGDSIDHPLRNLRSAWTIKKHGGMSIHFLRQRRKLCANPGQIEGVHAALLNSIG
jgi:hypothetical protein